MRYDVTIEFDENLVKESGLQPDEYVRQEMGWLEDSGISLVDLTAREETVDLASVLKDMTYEEALEYLHNSEGESPSGNEGIYSFGTVEGKEYLANIFRSDEEPGYVNYSFFTVQDDRMDILDSGFYSGYQTIENLARDFAMDDVPIETPDIRFVAHCSWEISSIEEYREALDEGKLEEPVPVPSWDQITIEGQTMRDAPQHEQLFKNIMDKAESAAAEKPDGKETFYFSYGTSDFFPFKSPGWVEVRASDRMEACEMYSSHFPKRDGLINCAFIYSENEWQKAGMDQGGPGQVCCQVIDGWGPHREQSQGLTAGEFALEQMDRMRDSFQRAGFTRAMTNDEPQEAALEDNLKQARDRAAEKNASRRESSEPRPSKGISR